MQITDLIILILVVVDVVSLSMVTFIFRWARRAMGNFRMEIMDLLSGESEESAQIIEKLGHTIYSKLYRYFNLKIPDSGSTGESNPIQEVANQYLNSRANQPGGSGQPDYAGLAQTMGITDPGFLKYLPLVQKFLKGNQGSEPINNSSESDRW